VFLGGDEDQDTTQYGSFRVDDELIENRSKMTIIANMIDIVEGSLRLLSPFAPFLAEELWQRIPSCLLENEKPESICLSAYPSTENVSFGFCCTSSMEVMVEKF